MENGINYTEIYNNDYHVQSGDYNRGRVNGYHHTSRIGVLDYRKGAKNTDIAQLKSVDRRNLITLLSTGDAECKFGIGFEVEKSRFFHVVRFADHSHCWAGYERDSSCGYEAVS